MSFLDIAIENNMIKHKGIGIESLSLRGVNWVIFSFIVYGTWFHKAIQ